MYQILFTLFLTAWFMGLIPVAAQNSFISNVQSQPQTQSDNEAITILGQIRDLYQPSSTIKADFTLTIEVPEEQDMYDKQTGTVYIKGDMFKVVTASQEIICNNEVIWTYLKEVNELQVSTYEPDETMLTPSQLFSIYEEDFYSRYAYDVERDGEKLAVLELTPLDKNRSYFKIYLSLVSKTSEIREIKVLEKNGTHLIYTVNSWAANEPIENSFFSFDPGQHPGIEVVDLR